MKKLTVFFLTIALLIGSILSPQITPTTKAESSTNGLSENFDYSLQTIYGDTVSVSAETTKTKDVTMLIFGRTTCLNTLLEIDSISKSDWISNSNINVIFVEIEQADLETNKTFANEYGCDEITFCYDTKATNYGILCKYTALMETTSTTLPVTVLVDHNNYIQNILTAYHSADDLFQEMNQFTVISAPQQPVSTTSPVKRKRLLQLTH